MGPKIQIYIEHPPKYQEIMEVFAVVQSMLYPVLDIGQQLISNVNVVVDRITMFLCIFMFYIIYFDFNKEQYIFLLLYVGSYFFFKAYMQSLCPNPEFSASILKQGCQLKYVKFCS